MFQPNRVWARSLWRRGSVRIGLLAGMAALGAAAGVAVFRAGAPGTAPVTALDAAPPAPPAVVWTTEEIGRMPPVLLLQAGKSLQMDVAPNAAQIRAGGTWKAEFGQFKRNGLYTAPSFTPPYGTDEITFFGIATGEAKSCFGSRSYGSPSLPGKGLGVRFDAPNPSRAPFGWPLPETERGAMSATSKTASKTRNADTMIR